MERIDLKSCIWNNIISSEVKPLQKYAKPQYPAPFPQIYPAINTNTAHKSYGTQHTAQSSNSQSTYIIYLFISIPIIPIPISRHAMQCNVMQPPSNMHFIPQTQPCICIPNQAMQCNVIHLTPQWVYIKSKMQKKIKRYTNPIPISPSFHIPPQLLASVNNKTMAYSRPPNPQSQRLTRFPSNPRPFDPLPRLPRIHFLGEITELNNLSISNPDTPTTTAAHFGCLILRVGLLKAAYSRK